MLAYSGQELVIEPFAGAVFRLSPGQSTGLTGLHHAGVLGGMALVAVWGFAAGSFSRIAMRAWTMGGCAGSALAALGLAIAGLAGPDAPLRGAVLVLGIANGAFAVAAIGSMMGLASAGRASREGTRMGMWGAAQALAFGAGGLVSTAASDVMRLLLGDPALAYGAVFVMEAALFAFAAVLAVQVFRAPRERAAVPIWGGQDAKA
jgi:BCD family chlorophyll transporter-like MFS transporter